MKRLIAVGRHGRSAGSCLSRLPSVSIFILMAIGVAGQSGASPGVGGAARPILHVNPTWSPAVSGWTWHVPVTNFWFDPTNGRSLDIMLHPPTSATGRTAWAPESTYLLYKEIELVPAGDGEAAVPPLTFWQESWVVDTDGDTSHPSVSWNTGMISSEWADPIGMGNPTPELFHDVMFLADTNDFWLLFKPVEPPVGRDPVTGLATIVRMWNEFSVHAAHNRPLRVRAFAIPEPATTITPLGILLACCLARRSASSQIP